MVSMPCSRIARTCSGRSRRPRRPPWIFGCSVFTRPSSISGKPVYSLTCRTRTPASARSFAVPPVDRMSKPSAASPRANSITPRLSLTLTSALDITPLLHVDTRHALADRRQHLVGNRLAPAGELVGAQPVAEEDDALAHVRAVHVGHVDHGVIHADAARDRRAPPAHDDLGAVGRQAMVAVGIADGQ